MQTYKDLIVWQRGVTLVTEVYRLTERFPKTEIFGLTSQMCRAAVSIPSNLAEGFARKSRAENAQFVRIAFGSGAELETQVTIAENLRFVGKKDTVTVRGLLDETMRMLNKLSFSLMAKN
ncbi:four helix bundle protein [Candidatus Kaiserbacteria bacterium]|nr:four helix bundle protein [Candidatus Kaiserbacteria bacterium]